MNRCTTSSLPAVILSRFLGDIRLNTVQNPTFRTGPLHAVIIGSITAAISVVVRCGLLRDAALDERLVAVLLADVLLRELPGRRLRYLVEYIDEIDRKSVV